MVHKSLRIRIGLICLNFFVFSRRLNQFSWSTALFNLLRGVFFYYISWRCIEWILSVAHNLFSTVWTKYRVSQRVRKLRQDWLFTLVWCHRLLLTIIDLVRKLIWLHDGLNNLWKSYQWFVCIANLSNSWKYNSTYPI